MKNGGMLRWYLFLGALIFTAVIVWMTTSSALGSGITDDTLSRSALAQSTSTSSMSSSESSTPTATLTDTLVNTILGVSPTTTPTQVAQLVAPKPTPRGDTPETARDPFYVRPQNCINAMCPEQVGAPSLTSSTDWTWIDGNSSIWYKMDDGHGFQLKIWLFANGQQGLSFDVYAPDQRDLYGKPVGRGSFNKSEASIGTDLFYSGRTSAHGVWHLKVTNNTSTPMAFALKFTRTIPSLNNVCDDCHKLIGIDWESCSNGNNSNFCDSLHDYYDTNPDCYDHNVDADLSGNCH